MIIKFSRHAIRRAKLYKLSEKSIRKLLGSKVYCAGRHEIIQKISGVRFPVKVVFVVEDSILTVVTNYPLKKEKE